MSRPQDNASKRRKTHHDEDIPDISPNNSQKPSLRTLPMKETSKSQQQGQIKSRLRNSTGQQNQLNRVSKSQNDEHTNDQHNNEDWTSSSGSDSDSEFNSDADATSRPKNSNPKTKHDSAPESDPESGSTPPFEIMIRPADPNVNVPYAEPGSKIHSRLTSFFSQLAKQRENADNGGVKGARDEVIERFDSDEDSGYDDDDGDGDEDDDDGSDGDGDGDSDVEGELAGDGTMEGTRGRTRRRGKQYIELDLALGVLEQRPSTSDILIPNTHAGGNDDSRELQKGGKEKLTSDSEDEDEDRITQLKQISGQSVKSGPIKDGGERQQGKQRDANREIKRKIEELT